MPSSLLIFLACAYDEELAERDIKGRLIVPKEVATRDVKANTDPGDFSTIALTDPRLIGPIFIGAYSAIDTLSRPYPIPEQGPIISQQLGNSLPQLHNSFTTHVHIRTSFSPLSARCKLIKHSLRARAR